MRDPVSMTCSVLQIGAWLSACLFSACGSTQPAPVAEDSTAVRAAPRIAAPEPEQPASPPSVLYPEVVPMAVPEVARTPYDPARTPPVPAPGADGVIALTWEPLAAWQFIPDETPLPTPLEEALDGKRVRIQGHIFPVFESATPSEFVLMRQGWQCCFGRPPELNEVIRVIVPPELRQTMPNAMVEVEACDFKAEIVRDDGFVVEIYTMTMTAMRVVE